jgi:two-component system cell cycle response regulator DivK
MELARTERPDLIVMDVGLPRMDGLTATRLLKADPATAPIPVLALTAHAMPGDEDSTLAAGCARYLAKPFDVHVFLDVVAELTGGTS